MDVRPLPPEEWHRLADLPFAAAGLPDPEGCTVIVVENEQGEIVGLWSVMTSHFVEGLWVREDYRKHSMVAGKLLVGMRWLLKFLGIPQVFTIVQDDYVAGLAEKAKFEKIPGNLYMLLVNGEETT